MPPNSTAIAPSATPASSSTARSGTPVHSAVPTASSTHGWPIGRGESPLRPLPAHSIVTACVTAGRARRSSSDSASSRPTSPPTSRRQLAGSTTGMS